MIYMYIHAPQILNNALGPAEKMMCPGHSKLVAEMPIDGSEILFLIFFEIMIASHLNVIIPIVVNCMSLLTFF